MAEIEVHITVVDDSGSEDRLDGNYTSVGVAHEKVQRFFTDLQLREV